MRTAPALAVAATGATAAPRTGRGGVVVPAGGRACGGTRGVVELGRGLPQRLGERLAHARTQSLLELGEVVPAAEHRVAGVPDLEAHPQVRGQRLRVEVGGLHGVSAHPAQHGGEGLEQ